MSDWLTEGFHYLALNLARGLGTIFERDSYLYWPYLVSSVVIAAFAWRWLPAPSARRGWGEFFDRYFSQKLWWHPSARADYWLFLLNALVLPLVFALLLLDPRQISSAMAGWFGLATNESRVEAGIAARIAYTVLFFLAYDFGRFVAHSLLHDVPILWEFHKVHHSALVLTPVTSFRAHPLELVLMAWGPLITTGIVTAAFSAVLSSRISFYSFLSVHALLFLSNLIGNLRHSPVWISYGSRWGRWLISPAHHQLHHSRETRHLGCNRGFELAIWDRLYGTLYVPAREPETFELGLGDDTESQYQSLAGMYWLPFVNAGHRVRRLAQRSLGRFSVR